MNMSNVGHPLTRDQVLVAHAAQMIARTSLSQDSFAQALSEQLHRLVPEKAVEKDVPDFKALAAGNDTAAFLKACDRWLRRVARWISGEVELPAWVEEAWVQALPGDYREACVNELASRYGLIGARAQGGDACPVSAFGGLVRQLGLAVETCSEVLADGRIDADDLALLPPLIRQLLAVESRACELRRLAENTLAAERRKAPLRLAD